MDIDSLSSFKPIITPVSLPLLIEKNISLDVLRLDLMHPLISGNKWYKLRFNIADAFKKGHTAILSFGGAYSNHLHALAYAGHKLGFQTHGIVRGENANSATLVDCSLWGMHLQRIPRSEFDEAIKTPEDSLKYLPSSACYLLPLGGDNELGVKGCETILNSLDTTNYDIVSCAVGTGTTLMGLIKSFKGSAIGFVSSSDIKSLREKIAIQTDSTSFVLNNQYKFGGFGKHNAILLGFMKEFQSKHSIELDKVYTAKAMYGTLNMIRNNEIENNSRILFVHTGGLQGNRSLALS